MMVGDRTDDSFDRMLYFPTMIFRSRVAEADLLNDYLLDLIRAERTRDQDGVERSNYPELGGWHSHSRLHDEDAFDPITDRVEQAGERISEKLGYDARTQLEITTMWSIINPPGASNRAHIHPGSDWSGVYYVHAPTDCGDIGFWDPRTAHVMSNLSFEPGRTRPRENWIKVTFTPEAGMMLLFPSWLYHGVDPNLATETGQEGERVIISFNLTQRRKPDA